MENYLTRQEGKVECNSESPENCWYNLPNWFEKNHKCLYKFCACVFILLRELREMDIIHAISQFSKTHQSVNRSIIYVDLKIRELFGTLGFVNEHPDLFSYFRNFVISYFRNFVISYFRIFVISYFLSIVTIFELNE